MNSRQPNSSHCFVCGVANPFGLHLSFYNSGEGEVSAETIIPEQYQSYPGVVHGGIVAALLDEAAGRAHVEDGSPRLMYTAHLNIRYRRKVPIGQPIRLVGRAGVTKSRTAAATSAIYDSEGNLLAEAEALMVNLPDEIFASANLEELGWRVYSDAELGLVHTSHDTQETGGAE